MVIHVYNQNGMHPWIVKYTKGLLRLDYGDVSQEEGMWQSVRKTFRS